MGFCFGGTLVQAEAIVKAECDELAVWAEGDTPDIAVFDDGLLKHM